MTKEDIQLECIVETIRNTRDHATLRSCLSLLTAAVHISPVCLPYHSSLLAFYLILLSFILVSAKFPASTEMLQHLLKALFSFISFYRKLIDDDDAYRKRYSLDPA